ncbi:hypothetical protein EMPG_16946 [Blastomyces silverae]|uniref:Uncharacterized protein n=1 Tax=Blastomyces silverae TaxID=2060906 RepID=A0A0H1B918_9EURO|nr:hypothetical protein EMPG_16946 [Blastomyces silverae]
MDSDSDHVGSDQESVDLGPTDEPHSEDDLEDEFDSESLRVLEVVSEGNEDELRLLLDKGVNLRAVDRDGQTALHLAVINHHVSLAELLLKAGSNTEAASHGGSKPLYIAAELGNVAFVNLLLRFSADVESHNDETGYTAFHQALLNGHADVAEALLENEADIDALTPDGHTPLFSAVIHDNLDITEFLLENGANKYLRDDNGKTVDNLATSDLMLELLRSDRVLQGPSVERRKAKPDIHYTVPVLPADETDKLKACQGFEGTIIDFFVEGTEQRIEKTVSVYDILYGKGPAAIMEFAKEKKIDKQPSFRWYHLPANNMEWVETLVSRHFGERDSGAVILNEESKSKLALTNGVGQQFRASASLSSYMRPLCRTINSPDLHLGNDTTDQLMLFIPFLHFETHAAYKQMAAFLKKEKDKKEKTLRSEQRPPSKAPPFRPARKKSQSRVPRPPSVVRTAVSSSNRASTENTGGPSQSLNIFHGARDVMSAIRTLGSKVRQTSDHVVKTFRKSSGQQDDVEKGKSTTSVQDDGRAADNDAADTVPTSTGKKDVTRNINSGGGGVLDGSNEPTESKPADKVEEDQTSILQIPPTDQTVGDTQNSLRAEDPTQLNVDIAEGNTGGFWATENPPSPRISISKTHTQSPVAKTANSPIGESPDVSTPVDQSGEAHATLDASAGEDSAAKRSTTRPGTDGHKIEENDVPPKIDPGIKRRGTFPDIPENIGQQTDATTEKTNAGRTKPRIPFDEHLVKGYLSPLNPADSPLHLRRTLDQYFYTHLTNTTARDDGQVVYRYTRDNFAEPKIFMIDQLWLWVLNDNTIISCFPQRWDVWSGQPPPAAKANFETASPPNPIIVDLPPFPDTETRTNRSEFHGRGHGHDFVSHGKVKDKSRSESGFMLGWVTGKTPKSGFNRRGFFAKTQRWRASVVHQDWYYRYMDESSSSSGQSSIEKRRLALLKRDPLNVHQMILSHIGLKTRDPLTSAQDLAQLIASFCIGLFDQYSVPDEYQFFDFFERSIGAIIDQETQCFEEFANRLDRESKGAVASSEVFSIRTETQLLVEIKDIIDELGILHMILSDQTMPLEEFSKLVAERKKIKNGSVNEENSSPLRFPVLENHIYRVEKMQRLANQTYKALYNLLDLKQKQNNVSEALSARKQAENASMQAEATKQLTERGLENADFSRKQADESIRQGRTVLVFTVVTIIFLPLSFMAAFFAINIDAFPWNNGDKLPMDYVLRYMLSISGAISIPFILIALNQDRIANFLKNHGQPTAVGTSVVLLLVILLSVIWTRDLASGMKAAVTIFLVILTILGLAVRWIYRTLFSIPGFMSDFNSDSS